MKLSPEEKADRKAAFKKMRFSKKLEYIFAYYKLPIVLILIALIASGTVLFHAITRKNNLLYLGFANVSVGEDMEAFLTDGFIKYDGANPKKNQIYTYTGLYLSDDPAAENHEYSYASRLKMIAAVNAKQMDIVLLNKESYDLLSRNEYLLDLSAFLQKEDPDLYARVSPYVTGSALQVSELPSFYEAGFPEPVYLCVIANSPRCDEVIDYLAYVTSM